MRILIVEDEGVTAYLLKKKLKEKGVEADWLDDASQAATIVLHNHYDIVILDLDVAGSGGLAVLKRLRRQGIEVPVIIMAHCGTLQNMLTMLEGGADVVLEKPVLFAELLVRIQAITRRATGNWTGELQFNGLIYDPVRRQVSFKGRNLQLSKREGQVLELLVREKGKTVVRETILGYLWGSDEVLPNSVDALVKLLRKKIQSLPKGIHIRTVRGVGYRLDADTYQESSYDEKSLCLRN